MNDVLEFALRCCEIALTVIAAGVSLLSVAIIVRIRMLHWNLAIILVNLLIEFYIHVAVVIYTFLEDYFIFDTSKR
jgi:hypothetical protein